MVLPSHCTQPIFIAFALILPRRHAPRGQGPFLACGGWIGGCECLVLQRSEWTNGYFTERVAGQNRVHFATLVSHIPAGDSQRLWGTRAQSAICTHHKNIVYWGFQQILLNDSISLPLLMYISSPENVSWQFHISKCWKNVPRLKLSAICKDVKFYSWMHFFPSRVFSTW